MYGVCVCSAYCIFVNIYVYVYGYAERMKRYHVWCTGVCARVSTVHVLEDSA